MVDVGTGIAHPEALLDLAALPEIRVMSDRLYGEMTPAGHPTRQLFETLKARGIRV